LKFRESPAVLRDAVTNRKVDEGGEQIDLDAEPHPLGIHDDGLGGAQQVEETDGDHQRRVLEERDRTPSSVGVAVDPRATSAAGAIAASSRPAPEQADSTTATQ
jgi:hypothetical protein